MAGNVAWAKALRISVLTAMAITQTSALSQWWMAASAPFTQAALNKDIPHDNVISDGEVAV
jgi:hypothetical protein